MIEKKDILERLRADCQFGPDYDGDPESWMCHRIECEAADEIETLRKEVARLREEESRLWHNINEWSTRYARLLDERDEAVRKLNMPYVADVEPWAYATFDISASWHDSIRVFRYEKVALEFQQQCPVGRVEIFPLGPIAAKPATAGGGSVDKRDN